MGAQVIQCNALLGWIASALRCAQVLLKLLESWLGFRHVKHPPRLAINGGYDCTCDPVLDAVTQVIAQQTISIGGRQVSSASGQQQPPPPFRLELRRDSVFSGKKRYCDSALKRRCGPRSSHRLL